MIFKDDRGTKFQWKVICLPISLNEEKEECFHCHGKGRFYDEMFSYSDCDFCYGLGKINKSIHCYDNELEKFLESKIEEYYRSKE